MGLGEIRLIVGSLIIFLDDIEYLYDFLALFFYLCEIFRFIIT